MSRLCLITGGVRSGKSRFAEEQLHQSSQVLYIATARCLDEEMARRIEHHRASRPSSWITAEASSRLDLVLQEHPEGDILLDCVTNMVTNLMLDQNVDYDSLSMTAIEEIEAGIREEFRLFVDTLRQQGRTAILVSGEVGMGLVPVYRMGRVFTDILGRLNQWLASQADEVYFMACGIPMKMK